ncbi:MAG: hypothetical protein K2Q45_02545 [Nitrosomonas sp.]|nr:hypothetical protein [Nitrosomonas sp.]
MAEAVADGVVASEDKTKVCAVISVSESDENCFQAMSSVVDSPQFFNQVILIKKSFNNLEQPYEKYEEHVQSLAKQNISVSWQSELNVEKINALAIIRLEPDVYASKGALQTLVEDMIAKSGSKDHFAVSSILIIDLEKSTNIIECFPYGFLLVIMMLDFFRYAFAVFGYSRTVDVRGQLLSKTYPNKVRLAPNRWWAWWFGTGISSTSYGGASAIQWPDKKDQGLGFVLRTIKTHKHMSFGICWLLFYFFYYLVFAFPFWHWLLSPTSFVGRWLTRDIYSLFYIIPSLLHLALVGFIAWWNVRFPNTHIPLVGPREVILPLQVLLYPFYLAASPLFFLYGRFHFSRAAWESAAISLKRRKQK